MEEQKQIYKQGEMESISIDNIKNLQRYLRKLFRQFKFTADNSHDFKYPCFTMKQHPPQQTVFICEWLLRQLGEIYMYSLFIFVGYYILISF